MSGGEKEIRVKYPAEKSPLVNRGSHEIYLHIFAARDGLGAGMTAEEFYKTVWSKRPHKWYWWLHRLMWDFADDYHAYEVGQLSKAEQP